MVWGYVSQKGVGTLVKVDGNINAIKYIEILENNLRPVINRDIGNNQQYVFQDDNAPVHRARVVKD